MDWPAPVCVEEGAIKDFRDFEATSFVDLNRISVQGVKSLGGHFACLCREFDFYEVKKILLLLFQIKKGNTFTLFISFIVKSLQKEQNSTNLLL